MEKNYEMEIVHAQKSYFFCTLVGAGGIIYPTGGGGFL